MKTIPQNIASRLCLRAFSCFGRRERDVPKISGAEPLYTYSRDGLPIDGWYALPEGQPRGTIVFGHGFASCANEEWILNVAEALRTKFPLAACAFDFRHHGLSGSGVPTFGTAEAWDMRAFMDAAQDAGLPGPFILIGGSLGGMAAQRVAVEDRRVIAAAMLHVPGWPWDAIGKVSELGKADIQRIINRSPLADWLPYKAVGNLGQRMTLIVANMINSAYGWDILADGDLRSHAAVPEHMPLMFYIMGDRDIYDYRQSLQIYHYLYPEEENGVAQRPSTDADKHKWYIVVSGATHPDDKGEAYYVWDWPDFDKEIDAFVRLALQRAESPCPIGDCPESKTEDEHETTPVVTSASEGSGESEPEPDTSYDTTPNMGQHIRGVNLGGWLVLEKWMTPSLFEGLEAVDETTFSLELGDNAQERLAGHWENFITEDDFAWLSWCGINGVRIPVGYWIFGPPYPYHPAFGSNETPFVSGGIHVLDNAFDWADKYGLNIQIDLHAAPGCQNGFDNGGMSGVVDWPENRDYIAYSLSILERLAQRYRARASLNAIEVLNEPRWDIPTSLLKDYTEEAYHRIRKYCLPQDVAVVFHDSFRGCNDYKGFLLPPAYENVVFDIHRYQCFAPADKQMDIYGNIQKAAVHWKNEADAIRQELGLWTYVGEWSLGLNATVNGNDQFQRNVINRAYGASQLATFERYLGWYFWSYKTETSPEWSFRDCVESGWLPENFK